MNRYRTYGQLDDQPEVVGDGGFNRLDMLTDPALLPPGSLPVSENLRFDNNGTQVRAGLALQFAPGTNAGTLLHAGVYTPGLGADRLALVTATSLVIFDPGTQTITTYPFPAGQIIGDGDHLDTIQAGLAGGTLPQLFIPRGFANPALQYDGNVTVSVAASFQKGEFALYYQDRIAVNGTSQSVAVSNFDNFTTWNTLNQFQILKGGDEYLTCFLSYQKDYVLMGTQKSWWVAFFQPQVAGSGPTSAGYEGPLAGDTSFLRQITREAGPVGPRAACDANGKIYFIADQAVYAFQPQLDNELTVIGRPISASLQPLMSRMNTAASRGACIARWGYRLYFALPINDAPLTVTSVNVVTTATLGADLPFDLPVNLAAGSLVTVITASTHNVNVGDTVLTSGAGEPLLNGHFPVVQVTDPNTFVYACDAPAGSVGGNSMTVQKLALRNNRILVFNLKNEDWESADTLPAGCFADWLLVAQYGSRNRLWLVDQTLGPALYEEKSADDIGTVVGGLDLPFDLPVDLNLANYASTQIPAHLTTRCFRWGYMGTMSGGYSGSMTSAAVPRKLTKCEVRASLDANTSGTLTLLARTPNNKVWSGTKNFTATDYPTADAAIRRRCGARALEAQLDIVTNGGRPTFRALEIETVMTGRVEE